MAHLKRVSAVAILLAAAAVLAGQTESAALRQGAASAFRAGRFADAEMALRRLLKQVPADPAVLGFLGAVLDAERKYQDAEPFYQAALAQGVPSPALLNNLGNHYLARGQAERARRYFERLVTLDPNHPNANLQLARLAIDSREGPWEVTKQQGGKALQYLAHVGGSDPAVLLLRAEALHWAGRRAEALAALRTMAQDGDARVQFSLGMTCARLELYDRAEAAFSAVLAQRPTDFDVLYNLGRAAARAQHYDRAQRALEVALRLQPASVESLFELAQVYSARQDYNHAVYLLAEARKLAPKHTDILLALARAAEDAGYYPDSIQAYGEYLQLRPGDDTARRDRALIYGYAGERVPEGIRELTWYVSRHPADPLGHYDLGLLSAAAGQLEPALASLNTALRLSPTLVPARYSRAVVLTQLGRAAESVPDLQAVLYANPEDASALDQLGLVWLTLDRPAEAEKVLRRAIALAPGKPEILFHLGRTLMRLDRRQEAAGFLARFQSASQKAAPPRRRTGVVEFIGRPVAEQKRRSIQALRQLIAMSPEDADLKLRLGNLLLADGRRQEAAEVFQALLAMKPDSRISQDAGTALLGAEEFALACDFLRRAAADRPAARLDLAIALFFAGGAGPALDALAAVPDTGRAGDYLLIKATILDAAGQSAEAARVLESGLHLATTRPQVARPAALLLVREGRKSEALDLLSRAIQSMPDSADLLLTKAIVLALMNREAESAKIVSQVESRWPEWARTYVVHALLLERQARASAARQKIQIALALGPWDPAARCALARLEVDAGRDSKCDCLQELLFPACETQTGHLTRRE